MKIKYLGHSAFLITTSIGTRILTDPFDPSEYPGALNFGKFDEPVNVVTVSHSHRDHANVEAVKGSPIIIRGNGKFVADEVEFLGVETYHDTVRGEQRGKNTVFIISVDGLRVAHMGDLGHVLTADQAAEIGVADVALIPIGGHFTIDCAQASKVAEQVEARIMIPMHYKNDKCLFDIATLDEFIEGKPNVVRADGSAIDITKDTLPAERRIVVLEPAL